MKGYDMCMENSKFYIFRGEAVHALTTRGGGHILTSHVMPAGVKVIHFEDYHFSIHWGSDIEQRLTFRGKLAQNNAHEAKGPP